MAHKLWPLFLASTFLVASCIPMHQHILQKRSQPKLCGRMLVEALAIVCQNQYYDPSTKRSDDYDYDYPSMNSFNGFLDPRSALSFLSKQDYFLRDVRGVSDECCKKSCSYNELLSYCYRPTRSLPQKEFGVE